MTIQEIPAHLDTDNHKGLVGVNHNMLFMDLITEVTERFCISTGKYMYFLRWRDSYNSVYSQNYEELAEDEYVELLCSLYKLSTEYSTRFDYQVTNTGATFDKIMGFDWN